MTDRLTALGKTTISEEYLREWVAGLMQETGGHLTAQRIENLLRSSWNIGFQAGALYERQRPKDDADRARETA